jgi:RNA polymerase sigma factor (sigma-70 family)
MEAAMFDQWRHLVDHIVGHNFEWAYRAGASSVDERPVSRLLEREDLLQEGRLALLEAWRDYRSDHEKRAKFITYAYYCVYWKVFRFVCNNLSPVSMRGWQKDFRSPDAARRWKFAAALACHLFSEVDGTDAVTPQGAAIIDYREKELSDFEDHCLEKLRAHLVDWEVEALLQRFSGKTYSQIGQYLECSRETARKVVKQMLEDAKEVLKAETSDTY